MITVLDVLGLMFVGAKLFAGSGWSWAECLWPLVLSAVIKAVGSDP